MIHMAGKPSTPQEESTPPTRTNCDNHQNDDDNDNMFSPTSAVALALSTLQHMGEPRERSLRATRLFTSTSNNNAHPATNHTHPWHANYPARHSPPPYYNPPDQSYSEIWPWPDGTPHPTHSNWVGPSPITRYPSTSSQEMARYSSLSQESSISAYPEASKL